MEKSELRKFILTELSKMELKGMTVTDFSLDELAIRLVIMFEASVVEFLMKNEEEFQILSVTHQKKKYVDELYLKQFEHFIEDVTKFLNPIVKEKMEAYEALWNTIEYREERVEIRKEQLEKRRLEIEARTKVLQFQTQAIDVEEQFFEADKIRNEMQGVRKWGRENDFLLKWVASGVGVFLLLLLILFIVLL